jgi:hypothetical protein
MQREEILTYYASYSDALRDLGLSSQNATVWGRSGVPLLQQIRLELRTDCGLMADRDELEARAPEIAKLLDVHRRLSKKERKDRLSSA